MTGLAAAVKIGYLLRQGVISVDLTVLCLPLGIGLLRCAEWSRKAGILVAVVLGLTQAFLLFCALAVNAGVSSTMSGFAERNQRGFGPCAMVFEGCLIVAFAIAYRILGAGEVRRACARGQASRQPEPSSP